ncbi:MAG: phosphatidate cytidylyltransferase [Leadbetterella sp.]
MIEKIKDKSNLTQRIVTALIAVPLIVLAIFYDGFALSGFTYFLLILGLCMFTQYEFYKLLGMSGSFPLKVYGTFCGGVMVSLSYFVETGKLSFDNYYLLVPLMTLTFFIKLYRKKDARPFENLAYTFLGLIYVAIPFTLMNELAFLKDTFQPFLPMGVLLILWANDSGAYFSGRFLGKRKLFERISPKKTWEGFVGGGILAVIFSAVYAYYTKTLSTVEWVIIANIIVITGTLGDLVESLFKRSIAIKDSGSILPGHGGFLDRFDGLLLSMPFIVTFIKLYSRFY